MHRHTALLAGLALTAAALTACGSTNSSTDAGGPSSAPTSQSTAPAGHHKARSSAPTQASTGPTPAVDPCDLVTTSEASSLAGTTFTSGTEKPTGTGGKLCVYGGQTTNVFEVLVAQAPDAATAQSEWQAEESKAQHEITTNLPPSLQGALHIQDVSGVGDRAATVSFSRTLDGHQVSISGIYVLQGATFFTISDLILGQQAPSTAQLEQQAQTSLGRL